MINYSLNEADDDVHLRNDSSFSDSTSINDDSAQFVGIGGDYDLDEKESKRQKALLARQHLSKKELILEMEREVKQRNCFATFKTIL